jgi:hypothetical protein
VLCLLPLIFIRLEFEGEKEKNRIPCNVIFHRNRAALHYCTEGKEEFYIIESESLLLFDVISKTVEFP